MNKGERTRKDIIDKAFLMAGDIGLEAVSLGALAGETGLSKSGLFAHFKSKEALQLEVVDEVTRRFTDSVMRPALTQPRGEPRVRGFFRALSRLDCAQPPEWRLHVYVAVSRI